MTKYGVKLTIIDELDFEDLRDIAHAIIDLGYTITVIDNGNYVCFKEGEEEAKQE